MFICTIVAMHTGFITVSTVHGGNFFDNEDGSKSLWILVNKQSSNPSITITSCTIVSVGPSFFAKSPVQQGWYLYQESVKSVVEAEKLDFTDKNQPYVSEARELFSVNLSPIAARDMKKPGSRLADRRSPAKLVMEASKFEVEGSYYLVSMPKGASTQPAIKPAGNCAVCQFSFGLVFAKI